MSARKILIIDDYPNLVHVLTMRLQSAGYAVIASGDGLDGLYKARTENPDLILLDVLLPKMDGFKICRLMKSDEKRRHIPIIMLTSRARDVDRLTGLEMGADAYMYKPYDSSVLMDTIGAMMLPRADSIKTYDQRLPALAEVV